MRAAAALLVALLAACGSGERDDRDGPQAVVEAPAVTQTPSPPPPRYVGRWAAKADMCTTGWWRFWNDEVLTGMGEMRCDLLPPDEASGDVRRRAVCQAEGTLTREEWVMTYPAIGRMTVQRDDNPPVALVRC